MSKINVLITGGNAGLGLETIKALIASSSSTNQSAGYRIIMGSRSIDKAKEVVSELRSDIEKTKSSCEVEPLQIDITDDASIQTAFKRANELVDHIDVLVNNAGAQFDHQFAAGKMGLREMWNANYNTNVTSTYIVTETFMPLLFASSQPRLVFVASGTASLHEASLGLPRQAGNPPKGWPKPPAFNFTSYRCSKVSVSMLMLEWKRILGSDSVKIFGLDPGFLATSLGGLGPDKLKQMGAIEPSVGANVIKDVIDGKRDADHGKTVRREGTMPW